MEIAEEAVKRITEVFEKYGYSVDDLSVPKLISETTYSIERKRELKEWKGDKFDLWIYKEGNEFYIVECKGKTFVKHKVWVDIFPYDTYWHFTKMGVPFLYFIWVKENNKIYRHDVVDPKDFKVKKDRGVYLIPEDFIHEIKPSRLKSADLWASWDSLKKALFKD